MALSVDRGFEQRITGLANGSESAGFNPTAATGEIAELNQIEANGRVELWTYYDPGGDATFEIGFRVEDVHPAAADITNSADRAIRADKWWLQNDTDFAGNREWRIKNVSGGSIDVVVQGVILA